LSSIHSGAWSLVCPQGPREFVGACRFQAFPEEKADEEVTDESPTSRECVPQIFSGGPGWALVANWMYPTKGRSLVLVTNC
jgi:hypothetical protein